MASKTEDLTAFKKKVPSCRETCFPSGNVGSVRVPDIVFKQSDTILHGADLCIPLSHCLNQVAIGLLRLLQQLVGCHQLRNNTYLCIIEQLQEQVLATITYTMSYVELRLFFIFSHDLVQLQPTLTLFDLCYTTPPTPRVKHVTTVIIILNMTLRFTAER